MPIGIAAEATHPVEYLVGNIIPVAAGPALLKCHILTMWVWIAFRSAKSVEAHSGYSFPWTPFQALPFANAAAAHDYHHSTGFTECYGSILRVWDDVCGTNANYMEAVRCKGKRGYNGVWKKAS